MNTVNLSEKWPSADSRVKPGAPGDIDDDVPPSACHTYFYPTIGQTACPLASTTWQKTDIAVVIFGSDIRVRKCRFLHPQDQIVPINHPPHSSIDKYQPALMPLGRNIASRCGGTWISGLASRRAHTSPDRFGARQVQNRNQIIGYRRQSIVIHQKPIAWNSNRQ